MVFRQLSFRNMETLNKYFSAIAKPAFQRHGFASEQLAAQWSLIVGDAVASVAKPDKIKWPTQGGVQKQGGTLTIKAQAGRALEVQYEIPRLIEKLNQYLGYGAISAIKVVQTAELPELPKPVKRPMSKEAASAWNTKLAAIEDEDLKTALAKLASHTAPKGPTHSPFSTGENRGFATPPTSSRKTL
jgi:hypothetical protein